MSDVSGTWRSLSPVFNCEDEGNEFQKMEEISQDQAVIQNPNSLSSLPVLIY